MTINGMVRIAPYISKPINISVVIARQHAPSGLPIFYEDSSASRRFFSHRALVALWIILPSQRHSDSLLLLAPMANPSKLNLNYESTSSIAFLRGREFVDDVRTISYYPAHSSGLLRVEDAASG